MLDEIIAKTVDVDKRKPCTDSMLVATDLLTVSDDVLVLILWLMLGGGNVG